MKTKTLILLALFAFTAFAINAQVLPVWGSGPPENDNTGRVLTYGYNNAPNVVYATKDTVKLYPNYYEYIVQPSNAVADTITYTIPVKPPQLFTGSVIKFYGIAGASSNEQIRFRSGVYANGVVFKFSTAGDSTITLTASKHYYVTFLYDGQYLLETGKSTGQ